MKEAKRTKRLARLERELTRLVDGFRVLARDVELDEGLRADLLARDAGGALLLVALLPSGDVQPARAMLTAVAADDFERRAGATLARRFEHDLDLAGNEPRVLLVARRVLHRTVTSLERVGLPVELFELQRLEEDGRRRALLLPLVALGGEDGFEDDEEAYVGAARGGAPEEPDFDELLDEDATEAGLDPPAEDPGVGRALLAEPAVDAETRVRMELLVERLRRIDEDLELVADPRGYAARFEGAPLFTLFPRAGAWYGRLSGDVPLPLAAPQDRDEFVERVVERILGPEAAASSDEGEPGDLDRDDEDWDEAADRATDLFRHPILSPEELEAFRD